MRNQAVLSDREIQEIAPNEVLKVTALIYLKDALTNAQYEQCAGFVQKAKRFGAVQQEIQEVITEAIRGGTGRAEEVPRVKKTRRRV